MYINTLHIDGYGLYHDVSLEKIPSGLCIFLGENEAGKSTCVDFIRSMLAGFPPPGASGRRFLPKDGARIGGKLLLTLDTGEMLLLDRSPDEHSEELLLTDSQGTLLPANRLTDLLAGVSRESYTRIFGFSLNELERVITLDDVQDALAGATFGTGLQDPAQVLKTLETNMHALWDEDKDSPLGRLLESWVGQSTRISGLFADNAGFDEKNERYRELQAELSATTASIQALHEQRRLLERRLDAWQQWDEWRALGLKLEELPTLGEHFPEHGEARIEELQREERQRAYALARQEEKGNELRAQRDKLTPDTLLLMELPLLQRLGEDKTTYREALARLAPQEANCRRLAKELDETLTRLGSDWTCERIHQTDLSLFSHNALESTAIDLRAARSAHEAAIATMEQINHDQEIADTALKSAQNAVLTLPQAEALLDDAQRDDLRHTLARVEEAQRQLPEKNQNVSAAKTAFQRSWDALNIPNRSNTSQGKILDTLLLEQHKVRELATTVEQRLKDASEAEKNAEQIADKMAGVNSRIEALRQAHQDEGPDRNALDEQAVAVRRLRDLLQMQERDIEDKTALEQELAAEGNPAGSKKLSLIVLGSLLALTGIGMILAHIFLHLTSFALTQTLTIPINLWSGYLILFAGILGIWGGSPHDGEEVRRRQLEHKRREERLEACTKKIAKQQEEIDRLAVITKIESLDFVTLDAVEVRITRDREHCIRSEHFKTGMFQLTQEMEGLTTLHERALEHAKKKEETVQQARLAWHECLQSLGIGVIPDAAQAATFLTRVEMTRMSLESVHQAERALNTLTEELSSLVTHICSFQPVTKLLLQNQEGEDGSAAHSLNSVLSAASEVLASCREADKLREQRASLKAREAACQDECQRIDKRREEAALAMSKAEERLAAITERWQECLREIGLDQKLNPQTATEALKCMQDCLALETTLGNARDVLEQTKSDLEAFERPLAGILERTGQEGCINPDGSSDWLQSFDVLLDKAHQMERLAQERDLLSSRIKDEEKEYAMCKAELAKAREEIALLLGQASCSDIEEFLVKNRQHEERIKTEQRRLDLETGLKSIAAKEDFDLFVKGFEQEDRATQERRQDQLAVELEELEQKKAQIMKALAGLEVTLEELTESGELSLCLQEKALLEEDIRGKAHEWASLALARAILQKTRDDFERDRQPAIVKTASDIFHRITAGEWKGIVLSLEKRTLGMLRSDGTRVVAPEMLSRGTQEQAYLALRLAYIIGHAAFAEPLPLLMDEVLVNFDTKRALCTAKELARMAGGGNGKMHQIFYFTCHPETVEILRKHDTNATLFRVDKGSIIQE